MKIKSLLLSAAAGLAAVAGTSFVGVTTAQAQNVAIGTSAICGVTSGNYYVLPGTSICFQLGGRITFGMSYATHSTPGGGAPILSGGFIDQRTFGWSAQLTFRTRSVSNIGNTSARFVLGLSQEGSAPGDGEIDIRVLNGGTASAGLFPYVMAGTAMVTTKGRVSIASFPNAGFAGNGFRFVRGTTILSGNANDPTTGLGAGAAQPMAVIGSTPWSTVFNTGDGNVNVPRVLIHDSGVYVAFAIERKCVGGGCNNPSSLDESFLNSTANGGSMTRPDMIVALGQEPDWGNWQIVYMMVPDNNAGAAPWAFDDIAHALMAGIVVDSIPDVVFRLNFGYMHRTLGTLTPPGNTRITAGGTAIPGANAPVDLTGIASTDTGWFVTAGVDYDITDWLSWSFTGSYLQDLTTGVDKAHLSHALVGEDVFGVMGLGFALRNTWVDNGAPATRRFLTEFDVDYEDAFGVTGLDLSFDTNWLLDQNWSHLGFTFLPSIVWRNDDLTDLVGVDLRAVAQFDDLDGTFGFESLTIGSHVDNSNDPFEYPIVSLNFDPVTVGIYGFANFVTESFAFNAGGLGIGVEVEPLFGEVDFYATFKTFFNGGGFTGAGLELGFSGPITEYISFNIDTELMFNSAFNFTGATVVLGLAKEAEFFSDHEFSSDLEFNFVAGPGLFALDYIEWQNELTLTPGSASGYADISANFDVRIPFGGDWTADEVRYQYGLSITHTF